MTTLHFTLRQLEIFAAVVRTGQVKRAAAALHLSQAAVSQALRELAEALDLTLFERDGRRRPCRRGVPRLARSDARRRSPPTASGPGGREAVRPPGAAGYASG